MKKLLSTLLALAMIFVIMPQISGAALAQGAASGSPTRTTTLDLHDDGALAALSSESGVTVDGGVYSSAAQGWSYDAGTKTLTLSGANIQIASAGDISYGISLPAGSKIVLADGTESLVTANEASAGSSFAIFAEGDLSIEGGGALTATGGSAVQNSYGIGSYDGGTITISGGTVNATGGEAGSSYGIFAVGAITISGGTVNATGGTSTNVGTTGIATEAGGITINGAAIVNATGGFAKLSPENEGQGAFANSMGIYAMGGEVLIEGNAVVNAIGGGSENGSTCGIHLNKSFDDGSGGELTITGDTKVKAGGGIIVNMQNAFGGAAFIVNGNAEVDVYTGESPEGENIGISMTNGYMMLSDNASVSVNTGDGKYGSFGIFLSVDSESVGGNAGENDGKLIVSGGTLSVTCATARNSRAIVAQGDIEISGGTVSAQSGTATEETSTGIYAKGAIIISGTSAITAKSGTGPSLSAAVYSDGGITIDPSLVVMAPEGGGLSAGGIYISASAGTDGDYATDVHIASAPVETVSPEETSAPEATQIFSTEAADSAEPVTEESAEISSWTVWLIVTAAVVVCFGIVVIVIKKRKK